MRKALAAVGASVLGLAAAAAGGTPAQAAPTLPPSCTDSTQHTLSSTASNGADWYMDCVPQYGLGKAEFTISSAPDTTFPGDFVPLTDPSVTVTGTTTPPSSPTATGTYFSGTATGDFINLSSSSAGVGTLTYRGSVVSPVLGVSAILPANLPATCYPNAGYSYASAYSVSFGATSTTFSETTASGEKFYYDITVPARTMYLGFTITAGTFDTTAAACATDGTAGNTSVAFSSAAAPEGPLATGDHATISTAGIIGPSGKENTFTPLNEEFTVGADLGTFAQTTPPVAPTFTSGSPSASIVAGSPVSFTVAASGTAPFTFAIAAGALPTGLSLDSSTGVISGTPTAAGSFTYTVTATNTAGTATASYTQVVTAAAPTAPTTSDIHLPIVSG